MLGHELRNPLAPMTTALQLMRMRGVSSREQDVLERQVAQLSRLVDDLLDVSRVSRGAVELRRAPIELCAVVLRAAETASPMLEHRHQRLDLHVATSGLGIYADIDRMAQVVTNLLTNASRYSKPETTITVSGSRTGDRVALRIRDEGVGIAPEMLERIFEPFVQHRRRPDGTVGGLGLGLSIVRALVEAHGGTVRVTSDGENLGSEFVIELPATDVAPVETCEDVQM